MTNETSLTLASTLALTSICHQGRTHGFATKNRKIELKSDD